MNTEEIRQVLDAVSFPGWRWDLWLLENEQQEHLLRGAFERPDRDTGERGVGYSRQEFLPCTSTPDTIVKTCWVLIKLTIEHEAMEFFTYQGQRVFDPHMPVERLISLQSPSQTPAPPVKDMPALLSQESSILNDLPPMSFQAAKAALYPHLSKPNYLQRALLELEAMNTTKAIKKAAGGFLRKASADFDRRGIT